MKVLDCEVGYRDFKQCKTNDMKCATCNSVIIMGYPYLRYLYHKALSKTINIYLLEACTCQGHIYVRQWPYLTMHLSHICKCITRSYLEIILDTLLHKQKRVSFISKTI